MDLKTSLEELYPTSITESVSSGDYIKVVRNGNTSYFIKDGDNIIQLNADGSRKFKKYDQHNRKFTTLFRLINLNKLGI
jgi:hypothetical protein